MYTYYRYDEESFEPMSRGRSNSQRYSRSQSAMREPPNRDIPTDMKTLPASYRHRLRPQGYNNLFSNK